MPTDPDGGPSQLLHQLAPQTQMPKEASRQYATCCALPDECRGICAPSTVVVVVSVGPVCVTDIVVCKFVMPEIAIGIEGFGVGVDTVAVVEGPSWDEEGGIFGNEHAFVAIIFSDSMGQCRHSNRTPPHAFLDDAINVRYLRKVGPDWRSLSSTNSIDLSTRSLLYVWMQRKSQYQGQKLRCCRVGAAFDEFTH